MATLTDAMRDAQGIRDLDQYEYTVKTAVRDAVGALDSAVAIEDTHYFNHSAVPDFLLRWSKTEHRPLYIRRSFEEILAGHDLEHLADDRPVILSANDTRDEGVVSQLIHRRITGEAAQSSNTLVANSGAIDSLTRERSSTDSPLVSVLSSQVLPTARGVLNEVRTETLANPTPVVLESILTENFSEKALGGLRDLITLTQMAVDREIDIPPEGRALTSTETAQVLPWLLTGEGVRDDKDFWAFLATRLDLTVLQLASDALNGLDLTRVVEHGINIWTAKRGLVTAASPWARGPDGAIQEGWFIRDGVLTQQLSEGAFWFRSEGKALQGRGSTSSATWELMRTRLEGFQLLEVILRGIDRSITLNANRSPDVAADASSVVASLSDNYFVDELRIRAGLMDEERELRINVGQALVFNEANATIADMLLAMRRFINYRSPM